MGVNGGEVTMNILVLGGTGRTGKLIVQALLQNNHAVVSAGRRDTKVQGATFIQCDLTQEGQILHAVQGVDAVISALASAKGNPVCSSVARALKNEPDLRFISIGGAGVDAPGDQKGPPDKLIGWLMRRLVGEMLADRQAELEILQASPLRWTMLRPPRLLDGPAQGNIRLTFDRPASSSISRSDLAQAAIDALDDTSLVARAPFVATAKG
jgi:putative NADH-flavin reductase